MRFNIIALWPVLPSTKSASDIYFVHFFFPIFGGGGEGISRSNLVLI